MAFRARYASFHRELGRELWMRFNISEHLLLALFSTHTRQLKRAWRTLFSWASRTSMEFSPVQDSPNLATSPTTAADKRGGGPDGCTDDERFPISQDYITLVQYSVCRTSSNSDLLHPTHHSIPDSKLRFWKIERCFDGRNTNPPLLSIESRVTNKIEFCWEFSNFGARQSNA